MNEFDICKCALQLELDLQYKKLLICKLSNHGVNRESYQVDMPGKKSYSKIFSDINEAVSKFLELKKSYDARN